MQSKCWYFSRKGRVEGPFSDTQIKQVVKPGMEYMVWSPAYNAWQMADTLFAEDFKISDNNKTSRVNFSDSPALLKDLKSSDTISKPDPVLMSQLQMSKKMLQFTKMWEQLEKKQSKERQRLLQYCIKQQTNEAESLSKKLQENIQRAERAPGDKVKSSQSISQPKKFTSIASSSSSPNVQNSKNFLAEKNQPKNHKSPFKSDFVFPIEEPDLPITAMDLKVGMEIKSDINVFGSKSANRIKTENTKTQLKQFKSNSLSDTQEITPSIPPNQLSDQMSEYSEEQEMYRRMARRRRRRR